jgi:hypothetical protein
MFELTHDFSRLVATAPVGEVGPIRNPFMPTYGTHRAIKHYC